MALFERQPQPPAFYSILDDAGDLYKQFNRPITDYEALGRYPSFHPPAGSSSSSGVVDSNPPGEVSSDPSLASAASHSDHSQSKRSPRMRPSETSHEDSQPSQVSTDPTGQSWFNPEAEVWKPKKSSTSNKMRRAPPPARPAPQVPQQQAAAPPAMYSYESPALPQEQPLTGILIKEPPQQFERARGPPRKSAMKKPSQQPSPLPGTAFLAPVPTGYSTQTPRQPAGVLSPPSTVTNLPPPNTQSWISAPPISAGRRRTAKSHYGSSASSTGATYGSSASSTGATYGSSMSSTVATRGSVAGLVRYRHIFNKDNSSIKPSGPHQISSVIDQDPDSGSEKSPVLDKKPFVPNIPSSSSEPSREHELSDAQSIASARRPAIETLDQQSSLLPTIARNLPVPSSYPIHRPSSPSTVVDLSIKAPPSTASGWIPRWSRAETATSALNSEFGTSTSTSFSNFPSFAAFSSSSYHPHSVPRFAALDRITSEDDYSIEPPTSVPRQNLSITNEDWPSPRARYDSDSGTAVSSLEVEPTPRERIHPLPLTLEELFIGGMHTYRITTRLLSGEPRIQEVQIDVKPGWKTGTRIIFPDAGAEYAPGVFETMIFVVEQVHHERFTRREGGKLVYNTDIDLVDALKENGRREARKVVGLDDKVIEFYPPKGVINPGQEMVIKGEGMYTRSKSKVAGRGDLIIRWNIKLPDQVTADQIHRMRDIFKQ
ncbi:hypothetical protein FS837_002525 [Tulasnella sp. UAMH 9824]|nr:hypothetical protein FS837_002525 [Tulasnella sp. UAMH 9824]